MNQPNYRPQYISVRFGDTFFKHPRRFTTQVNADKDLYSNKGVLVTSGNMLESSDNYANLHCFNHCIVPEINHDVDCIKISDDAVQHYRSALTDFQKLEPFDPDLGVLKEGQPIFYCELQNGQTEITLFGHCPNFRIPYSPFQDGKASSAVDFIPKNIGNSDIIDLADAIFGFVRYEDKSNQNNVDTKTLSALGGRIFVEKFPSRTSRNLPKPIKTKPSPKFTRGQIVDAKVSNIKGIEVTYQLLDGTKKTEKEHKKADFLEEGQDVKVQITALKEDDTIKNIKYYE